MKKRGRPPIAEDKRLVRLVVMIRPQVYAALKDAASENSGGLSEYARGVLDDHFHGAA